MGITRLNYVTIGRTVRSTPYQSDLSYEELDILEIHKKLTQGLYKLNSLLIVAKTQVKKSDMHQTEDLMVHAIEVFGSNEAHRPLAYTDHDDDMQDMKSVPKVDLTSNLIVGETPRPKGKLVRQIKGHSQKKPWTPC